MRYSIYAFATALIIILTAGRVGAQGMAINRTGTPAAGTAMLDISDTARGLLIPRMTTAQRNAIASPATGLMIFQTDSTAGFFYYTGSTWTAIGGSSSLPSGTAGDLLYHNGSSWTKLPVGTSHQILAVIDGFPAWVNSATVFEPSITTTSVTAVTATSANSGGNVTADNGALVTAAGVVWSTSPAPTVSLSTKTVDATGTGSFTSNITGLAAGTTYYVRAYATNSVGTGYGAQGSFTTTAPTVPSVTTTGITGITTSAASGGGNITNDNGAPVTARGIVWSTSPAPTTALSTKTSNGTGSGVFTSSITGLSTPTTYYVRAYATNSAGTGYGQPYVFMTIPIGGTYGGGKIVYYLQPGDPGFDTATVHGLIAAPTDQAVNNRIWYNGSFTVTGATANGIGAGKINTPIIVANQGVGNYAAYQCDTLTLGGFTDWYLPSLDEVYLMYINKTAIGGFTLSGYYWSSFEYSLTGAYLMGFNVGDQYPIVKYDNDCVRAMRSF